MKNRTILLIVSVSILALAAVAQEPLTNAVGATAVTLPPGFEQVADLLPAKLKSFLTQAVVWIGSLSLIIAPFAAKLGNWLRDRLNKAAEGKAAGTDVWLARLFSNKIYIGASTLLRFINVNFPTLDELERAIALQREAVRDAVVKQTGNP